MAKGPRVALVRLGLRTHPSAEPLTSGGVRPLRMAWNDAVLSGAGDTQSGGSLFAFVRALDATGRWQRHPLFSCEAPPSGPIEAKLFSGWTSRILDAALAVKPEAVYLDIAGSLITTDGSDGLAAIVTGLRERLGANTVIALTLGAQTQFAGSAAASANIVMPGRSAANRDLPAAAEAAAMALRLRLAGSLSPVVAHVSLPLVWPRTGPAAGRFEALQGQVAQRTADHAGQVLSAGLIGGAVPPLSGSPGLSVIVTARHAGDVGEAFARDVARLVWTARDGAIATLLPLSTAVGLARSEAASPMVLVDSGDRVDLGASGRSTDLLSALSWGGASSVLSLGHVDGDLVEQAGSTGERGMIQATFDAAHRSETAGHFAPECEVITVRRDITVTPGDPFGGEPLSAAVLRFGEITVVVASRRFTPRADIVDALALDPASYRTITLKSDPDADPVLSGRLPTLVHEVDSLGPTAWDSTRSAHIFPLDRSVEWTPG